MDLYDWLLFLHVAFAFAMVAGIATFLAVAGAGAPTYALLPVAKRLEDIGATGALVFGVWLALKVDGYELWDGWILGALVAYFAAAGISARAQKLRRTANEGGQALPGSLLGLHAVVFALAFVILILMIFKPGA